MSIARSLVVRNLIVELCEEYLNENNLPAHDLSIGPVIDVGGIIDVEITYCGMKREMLLSVQDSDTWKQRIVDSMEQARGAYVGKIVEPTPPTLDKIDEEESEAHSDWSMAMLVGAGIWLIVFAYLRVFG